MRVWIDQDQCTGSGMCEDTAPDVFWMGEDGLAYVKEEDQHFGETKQFGPEMGQPGGSEGLARVPAGQEQAVEEAARECPGECIIIKTDD